MRSPVFGDFGEERIDKRRLAVRGAPGHEKFGGLKFWMLRTSRTFLALPNGKSIVLERQPGATRKGYAGLEDSVTSLGRRSLRRRFSRRSCRLARKQAQPIQRTT